MPKALSLISGGLDSLVATKLILEQGVEVEGINFFIGFSGDHDYHFKRNELGEESARNLAKKLGIKLHRVDVIQEFKPVLLNPKYGYGVNLNPCLDCKLFMISQAKKWMEQHEFDFLISGETLGQRPKSQKKKMLPLGSKISDNLILRPLSAQLLPETIPELRGWVKRSSLKKISGRSRSEQISLAKHFGFQELPQPAGGCLLTDSNFCRRFLDLLNHRDQKNYTVNDLLLLRTGRHLRPNENLKLIVGRNEIENRFIEYHALGRLLLQSVEYPGSVVLLDGEKNSENIELAAKTAAYFSKARLIPLVQIHLKNQNNDERGNNIITVASFSKEEPSTWYL